MSHFVHVFRRLAPLATLCAAVSLTAGCGLGLDPTVGSASTGNSPSSRGGPIGGTIYGGQQPINGATVAIWSVGTSGYGSAGTSLATTTTNSSGYFNFTAGSYTCPSSTTQMYLTAKGGNPGAGLNSAVALVLAIGPCSGASALTNLQINEVTTVATMAALQQYFNPTTETFGYPTTGTQPGTAFANNVSLIANMASITSGQVQGPSTKANTPYGTTSTVNVTVTPEYLKINLMANIIAACINTVSNASAGTSAACSSLLTDAVPPMAASYTSQPTQTFPTPTDTLQALYYMFTNPISCTSANCGSNGTSSSTNFTNLYNLASSSPPFAPAYSTAPTDWTIGINYASTSTCATTVNANQPSGTAGSSGTTAAFLTQGIPLAVDASGNIWTTANSSPGGLFEMSPVGSPLTCALGTLVTGTPAMTIDSSGNVWVGSSTEQTPPAGSADYYVYKWNTTTNALDSSWPTLTNTTYTTGSTFYSSADGMTADGVGDIFYSMNGSKATGIVKISGGATSSTPSTTTQTNLYVDSSSGGIGSRPQYMAVDASGNVWIADNATNALFEEFTCNVSPCTSATTNYTYTKFTDNNYPYGLAIGQTPIAVTTGTGMNAVTTPAGTEQINFAETSQNSTYPEGTDIYQPGATAGTITDVYSLPIGTAGTHAPEGVAMDGASNLWISNTNKSVDNWVTGSAQTYYSFSEVSWNGVNISATDGAGFTSGTANSISGGFQKPALIMPSGIRGIAVDPSGNVWGLANSGDGLTEIVGQAVPVVTPLSVAQGADTLGTSPQ